MSGVANTSSSVKSVSTLNTQQTENKGNAKVKTHIEDADFKTAQGTAKKALAEFQHSFNIVTLKNMLSTARQNVNSKNAELTIPSKDVLAKCIQNKKFSKSAFNESYNKMLKCAEQCDKASKDFSALGVDKFKNTNLLGKSENKDPSFDALKAYTDAQNNLAASIKAFMAESKSNNVALMDLMQSAQYRVSEALNFVAIVQTQAKVEGDAQPITDEHTKLINTINTKSDKMGVGVAKLADNMHLKQHILSEIEKEASYYFEKLDSLTLSQENLSPEEFTVHCINLQCTAHVAKEKINDLMNGSEHVVAERAMFQPLHDAFDRIEQRMDGLLNVNVRNNIIDTFKDFFPEVDMDLLKNTTLNNSGLNAAKQYLETRANLLDNLNKLADHKVGFDQFKDEAKNTLDILQKAGIQLFSEKKFGFADRNDNKPAEAFFNKLPRYLNSKATIAEVSLVDRMLDRAENFSLSSKSALLKTVDHKVSLSALIESSLRNIPLEGFNLEAADSALTKISRLGNGAINVVYNCEYEGVDAVKQNLIFKPEVSALRGYDYMGPASLEHNFNTSVTALNIVSSVAAESIGCGSVIAKSSAGIQNGQFGLFMEKAPGMTAGQLLDGTEKLTCLNGGFQNFNKYYGDLDTVERTAFTSQLMSEFNKLEWADVLSAQSDRHVGNYLIDIDVATNSVKLTGIDNDASFSISKIGMQKMDVSKVRENVKGPIMQRNADIIKDNIFDLSIISDANYRYFAGGINLKHAHKPLFIDKDIYTKLTNLSENDYRKKIEPYLEKNALDAAMSRFIEAQDYAKELQRNGKVIEDWSKVIGEEDLLHDHYSKNSYMVRDFGLLLPNVKKIKVPS